MPCEPVLPYRPPRSCLRLRRLEPDLRRLRLARFGPGADAVASPRMHRAADDAGIVAPGGQQEGVVGRAGQAPRLVYRSPRRHVIGFGADDEHRHADTGKIDASTVDLEFTEGKR